MTQDFRHQTLDSSVTKFRLGLYMSDLSQPMSLMRGLGPFAAMQREDPRLELVYPFPKADGADVGWSWLARCDAVFYSHPNTDLDLSVLWLAHRMNIPIWSEYVDDVFNVLPTNPHYQMVKNKKSVRANITHAIEWSAVCSAVSETCRLAYPNPERFVVIPEACLWPHWDTPRKKCISWRGLGSHAGDVETVLAGMCHVARDFPDWEWALLGEPSEEFVTQLGDAAGLKPDGTARVRVAPYYSTPFHAIEAWGGCAPYLHLVPLADNAFNRSKSHLAWLEASAIGAAVIVPDNMPEWQQPGTIPYYSGKLVYNGKTNFEQTLRRELRGWSEDRGQRAEDGSPTSDLRPPTSDLGFHPALALARAAIYPELTLNSINQRRWAVIRKLAKTRESRVQSPELEVSEVAK